MEQHQNGNGQTEQVTTVFVAGFPADTTHREVDNLCRFMPGFVKSKVSFSRGITLFALFDSVESAEAAIHTLKDQAFDASRPSEIMRVVMAKSNMRITDSGPPGGPAAFPAYPSQPAIGGRGISDAPRPTSDPHPRFSLERRRWEVSGHTQSSVCDAGAGLVAAATAFACWWRIRAAQRSSRRARQEAKDGTQSGQPRPYLGSIGAP
ncbi:unnamed protein product [Effrenium voratum]|nr:unnamed protein product [Effrenium voratum]